MVYLNPREDRSDPIAGGQRSPPESYWEATWAVLKKHGALLIADEVITGFVRAGSVFGLLHYRIEPDLITVAKELMSAQFRSRPRS